MWFFALIIMLITGYLGHRKGYSFFIWFLAAGCLGLIILAFLPFANDPLNNPHENERLVERGNSIGLVVLGIGVVIAILSYFYFLRL